MLNALANHGYLPRDGKDITLAQLMQGLKRGINLAPDASLIVGIKALQASSTGRRVSFHLDDLNKHGGRWFFSFSFAAFGGVDDGVGAVVDGLG